MTDIVKHIYSIFRMFLLRTFYIGGSKNYKHWYSGEIFQSITPFYLGKKNSLVTSLCEKLTNNQSAIKKINCTDVQII